MNESCLSCSPLSGLNARKQTQAPKTLRAELKQDFSFSISCKIRYMFLLKEILSP